MQPAPRKTPDPIQRLRVTIRGAVQGVGFRPFVYRLAKDLELNGWVGNSPQGVFVEVEGGSVRLREFLRRLPNENPPRSFIQSLESTYLNANGFAKFEIRESEHGGLRSALVLPDIATCADCVADVCDPANRRYQYPFTNCTNCGPRYSIIEALPYDRANTTMRSFEMCGECCREYDDPNDRRFHAQPNACPACGPRLVLCDQMGEAVTDGHDAMIAGAQAIYDGRIVAVKGIGGFHLMVDARNDDAVGELRRRKHREEKPLAVMFPTFDAIQEQCEVNQVERRLLTSPESPIVLLRKKADNEPLSKRLAPANPYLGAMLPYSPLHHLLMSEVRFPVVATSGNLSDEPICIDEEEALHRLKGIADVFLIHNRPIARHVDDSIVREMMGREMIVRRARGFAPLPLKLKNELPTTLAVGAHLKNSVAVSTGRDVFVSQHIGDMETREAFRAFRRTIDSLQSLYQAAPAVVTCDKHPDYLSTQWANENSGSIVRVQHHYAHVMSCIAENELEPPVLGIAWDGTGYGDDGTIWGGEFLKVNDGDYERVAHLRTFRLPGGNAAVKEPRRSALGVLYEIFGDGVFEMDDLLPVTAFTHNERTVIKGMLGRGLNAPITSSAGRLFDAVASLIGFRQLIRFEGQAAMELEFTADPDESGSYDFVFSDGVLDWEPMVRCVIAEVRGGTTASIISARFHNTLVEMILAVARSLGEKNIALSGGCFQNKYLAENAIASLRNAGFSVYWHQRVPTNDGGIALGQIAAAERERRINSLCV